MVLPSIFTPLFWSAAAVGPTTKIPLFTLEIVFVCTSKPLLPPAVVVAVTELMAVAE